MTHPDALIFIRDLDRKLESANSGGQRIPAVEAFWYGASVQALITANDRQYYKLHHQRIARDQLAGALDAIEARARKSER